MQPAFCYSTFDSSYWPGLPWPFLELCLHWLQLVSWLLPTPFTSSDLLLALACTLTMLLPVHLYLIWLPVCDLGLPDSATILVAEYGNYGGGDIKGKISTELEVISTGDPSHWRWVMYLVIILYLFVIKLRSNYLKLNLPALFLKKEIHAALASAFICHVIHGKKWL